MKQLALHSEAYRYIIESFKEWLQVTGYNEQAVYQLPIYIQEFLHYSESKGYAGLFQLDVNLMKEHYYKLKLRTNKRKGGGLSNSYLNKHLEALNKFSDYLRQSGRFLLQKLDKQT
jgi:integrase/recombinase XerD